MSVEGAGAAGPADRDGAQEACASASGEPDAASPVRRRAQRLGLAAPVGALCALLPPSPPLEVDAGDHVSTVCRWLHDRGLSSAVVRSRATGAARLFRLPDLVCPLLDGLRADPCAERALAVLGGSAVWEVAPRRALQAVDASTPLASVLDALQEAPGEQLLVQAEGCDLRLFGYVDTLDLLLRHARDSCPGFRELASAALGLDGLGGPLAARTASASDSVLRVFEDLYSMGLQGLPVLDDADPKQALLERVLGSIAPSDVHQVFLSPPAEAAKLVACTAREFVVHEVQELTTSKAARVPMRETKYPFVHADVGQTVETLASKLLAARTPTVALCSACLSEVRALASAGDVVRALRGGLEGVVFSPSRSLAPSPRLRPRTLDGPAADGMDLPQLDAGFVRSASAGSARTAEEQRNVSWADERRAAAIAEVFEYLVEATPKDTAPAHTLALTDAPADQRESATPLPSLLHPLRALPPPMEVGSDCSATPSGRSSPPQGAPSPRGPPALAGPRGADSDSLVLQSPQALCDDPGFAEVVMSCEGGPWRQLTDPAVNLPAAQAGGGWVNGHVHTGQATEQLQLVLYQRRDLVLYDKWNNRVYARRLTEEQAGALAQSRHSFCPLCRQHLDPSWAFVVEGYFDMLSKLHPAAEAAGDQVGQDGFNSNEEAAAAAGLHNIPMGLLNCGYYSRFFVEEKKLGSGSFGAVYLSRHVMDDIELGTFAVKKLALGDDTKRLRQVVREVKALERLRHMNIIDYKHSWLEVSRHSEFCPYVPFLFILMEYCNAGSLEDLIWPKGFVRGGTDNAPRATMLTEELIWLLFLDVCRGLRHLHSRSILHRDLKPSNILLNVDEVAGDAGGEGRASQVPRALLSDFGTCEILGEGRNLSGHVDGGYAIEFMAPERLKGEESDEPADMWSAGLVLYAMCYGDLPYHSEDPESCRSLVKSHTVLSDLPEFREQALRGLISALTARSPVARPTAEEAERVSCQAACRQAEAEVKARSSRRSPHQLPSLPPTLPLELTDDSGLRNWSSSPEPPAKISRIASEASLQSAVSGEGAVSLEDGWPMGVSAVPLDVELSSR